MYFFVLKVERALFVLVLNSQLLSIQAACMGWTSALMGEMERKKKELLGVNRCFSNLTV